MSRQLKYNHCVQCVDHSLKLQISELKIKKITSKYEELLKENKRLKAHIKYLVGKESVTSQRMEKDRCQICKCEWTTNEKHLCMDVKEVACEYCSSSFETTMQLCEHLKMANHTEVIYECERCPMVFSTATLLTFHRESKQTHPETMPDSNMHQSQTRIVNLDIDVSLTDKSNVTIKFHKLYIDFNLNFIHCSFCVCNV